RLVGGRRRAVRLLPERHDHGGMRALGENAEAVRRRHRRRDARSRLPLRHLRAHPRRDSHRQPEREMRTRREFLGIALLGGPALAIAFRAGDALADDKTPFRPNGWVRIDPDGTVTLTVGKSEMRQGVRTALTVIIADELEADWRRVRVVQAGPAPDFATLGTGGSHSVRGSFRALRRAGAAAREMLVAAAAAKW